MSETEVKEELQDPVQKEFNAPILTGVVKWFNVKHGYGFITK